jgi:methyl-accepting chemotaxis protein
MVFVGGYAIYEVNKLDNMVESLSKDKFPKTVMLNDVKNHLNIIARALRNTIIVDSKEEADKEIKRIIESREAIGKLLGDLEKVVHSDTGKSQFKAILEARAVYVQTQKNVIGMIETDQKEAARKELLTNVRKAQTAYFDVLDKMIEHQTTEVDRVGNAADHAATQAFWIILVVLFISALLSILMALLIIRSITRPMAELVAMNHRLAEGDLTVVISVTGSDEVGQLAESSRTVVANLHNIINRVADTSSQVASAANQLHSTAEQIATGAEEVAAQSGTVATAGEEMSATSSDIAQNCQMAAEGAQRASQTASDGAAVVERTVVVMGQIAEKVQESARTVESLGARSDQIGAIIGTIEDIADQTNLLALNAAIEAARAGEQGRGFAVVADEVRALAERTTRATKEIGEMIKAIQRETKGAVTAMEQGVHQVESGTVEAAKSGQALQEIMQQINDVAMQVNQIATAAEEQTATTSEISSNMMQITEVVQQTSQGAQESATAAAQLNGNAEELQRLVRQFKL